MITNKDVEKITGLSSAGRVYRLKQMTEDGNGIPARYKQGKTGAIRVYTEQDLQAILDYKAKKPGRKKNG